ncbi:hypothetical protein GEMRC1_012048 [Eukaryota sp. GEM-RC1]
MGCIFRLLQNSLEQRCFFIPIPPSQRNLFLEEPSKFQLFIESQSFPNNLGHDDVLRMVQFLKEQNVVRILVHEFFIDFQKLLVDLVQFFLQAHSTVSTNVVESCVFCNQLPHQINSRFSVCDHVFCRDCLNIHLKKSRNSTIPFSCPKCSLLINYTDFSRNILNTELFKALEFRLCTFSTCSSKISLCLNPDCKTLISSVYGYVFCPNCLLPQCNNCGCINDDRHFGCPCDLYRLSINFDYGNNHDSLIKAARNAVSHDSIGEKFDFKEFQNFHSFPMYVSFSKTLRSCSLPKDSLLFGYIGVDSPEEILSLEELPSTTLFNRGIYFCKTLKFALGYYNNPRYILVFAVYPHSAYFSLKHEWFYVLDDRAPVLYCPVLFLKQKIDCDDVSSFLRSGQGTVKSTGIVEKPENSIFLQNSSDQPVFQWSWVHNGHITCFDIQISRYLETKFGLFKYDKSKSSFLLNLDLIQNSDMECIIDFCSMTITCDDLSVIIQRDDIVNNRSENDQYWLYFSDGFWKSFSKEDNDQLNLKYFNYLSSQSFCWIEITLESSNKSYLVDFSSLLIIYNCSKFSFLKRMSNNQHFYQSFYFPILSSLPKDINHYIEEVSYELLTLICDFLNLNSQADHFFHFTFIENSNKFSLKIKICDEIHHIVSVIVAGVIRKLQFLEISTFVEQSADNMTSLLIHNHRLSDILCGIEPIKFDSKQSVMAMIAHILVWKLDCVIYGGFIRDFLLANAEARDIDCMTPTDDVFNQTVDRFLAEVRNVFSIVEFKKIRQNNPICTKTSFSIGDFAIDVDFTRPSGGFIHPQASPPFVEADVSNFIISKQELLSFKIKTAQENFSLDMTLRHCYNKEYVFFYDLAKYRKMAVPRLVKRIKSGWKCLSVVPDDFNYLFGEKLDSLYEPRFELPPVDDLWYCRCLVSILDKVGNNFIVIQKLLQKISVTKCNIDSIFNALSPVFQRKSLENTCLFDWSMSVFQNLKDPMCIPVNWFCWAFTILNKYFLLQDLHFLKITSLLSLMTTHFLILKNYLCFLLKFLKEFV